MQFEGVSVLNIFKKAKINVNLLIFLLNSKFYGKTLKKWAKGSCLPAFNISEKLNIPRILYILSGWCTKVNQQPSHHRFDN